MSKIINIDYILNKDPLVELKFYVKFFPKSSEIEEFVMILFLVKEEYKLQIIKYDFSQKERLHVHRDYLKISRKEYLNFVVNTENVLLLKTEVVKNWKKYVFLFKQKEFI